MEHLAKWWPFRMRGYEKFWAPMFGGGMATAFTVLVFWLLASPGTFDAPGPEELKTAIAGVIITFFAAMQSFIASNTEPVEQPPESNPEQETQ